MSIWLSYQQNIFKRYHSDKRFWEFYLQDGDKNQLAQILNKVTSLSLYECRQMPRSHDDIGDYEGKLESD